MKSYRNEFGFSVVQGMLLAAIVAGSSLVATRLMTDQKLAQKGAETRDAIEDLHNTIYSVLQDRSHCKRTIIYTGLTTDIAANPGTNYPLPTIVTANNRIVAEVGSTYMSGNVRIKTMRFLAQTGGQRNLEIDYERLNDAAGRRLKQGYGAKEIRKFITIRIQKEPSSGVFSACYAVSGGKTAVNGMASSESGNDISKDMCNQLNTTSGQKAFIWDEALSICKPNSTCAPGTVFTGIDSLGTVKCREIERWVNMWELIDSSVPATCPVGYNVKLSVNASNKIQITCHAANTCAAQDISWYTPANNATCHASVPARNVGVSVTRNDTTQPGTGSATATCTTSGWSVTGTCVSTCGFQAITWTQNGYTCNSGGGSNTGNATQAVSDTTAPGTGTGTIWCNPANSQWEFRSGTCGP